MITPGASCPDRSSPEEIAWYTVRTLSRSIVPALPGIMFLSGGQSEEEASLNLNAINCLKGITKPWTLSFSYGRALQQSVLKTWMGKADNTKAAQKALLVRAAANSAAQRGTYEGGSGDKSTAFVANYSY
jgi:fructose-bisphosphate aldolase class I